jgi:glycosyltransferase involved in cell wall biosynthesis
MKIAIIGSRGIPNQYGGFEQFTEHLSVGLTKLNYNITVYNPHFHSHQSKNFFDVTIVHKWCPEFFLGPAAHFIYDFLSLKDALKNKFDIILSLGYGSSSVAYLFLPIQKTHLITNMDGIEWKRTKWSLPIKLLMKYFEKIAAHKSHHMIADNLGIQDYLKRTYNKESTMIPYGATPITTNQDISILNTYSLQAYQYYIVIARLEPENNIEMILNGYIQSQNKDPIIIIGNDNTAYAKKIINKYTDQNIQFIGGIYNQKTLNSLRHFSKLYFHGHSVGGTNPSLLEAMASHSLIAAHDNCFNRSVLHDNGYYFTSSQDVTNIINSPKTAIEKESFIHNNLKKINSIYSWDTIINQYSDLFKNRNIISH